MPEIQAAESIGLRRTWRNAGIPSGGPTGTLAAVADAGDLLIDVNNKTLYQNTGSKASPTWTEKAASGAALATNVNEMETNGTGTANVLGIASTAAPINHVHLIGTHDHSDNTKGDSIVLAALGAGIFTAGVDARALFATNFLDATKLADFIENDAMTNAFLKAKVNDDAMDNAFLDAALASEAFAADAGSRAAFASGIWTATYLATDSVGTAKILNLNVTSEKCEVGLLSADVTGRALMTDGFFTATEVLGKFGTDSFDATACADVFADNAIPSGKVNWSYGGSSDISTITGDAGKATGSSPTVARIDHVHAIVCGAPTGSHVPDSSNVEGSSNEFTRVDHIHALVVGTPADGSLAATNAEGSASTFTRSDHAHKAILLDDVSFNFGAGSDIEILMSTANDIGGAGREDLVFALSDLNHALHIVDVAAKATDFNVGDASHPTIYIHSDTTPITDYMLMYHDGADAIIDSMGGNLLLKDTGVELVSFAPTKTFFNEPGADIDFQISSNDVALMFVLDGGLNVFALGVAANAEAFVKISNPAKTLATAAEWSIVHVVPAGATTTVADGSTYDYLATMYLEEPNIVKGGADVLTIASTLYILNAPSEASANYALYIASGDTGLQALTTAGLITADGGIDMTTQILDFTSGYIEFGTTPAQAGDIRQEKDTPIWTTRNNAGNGDISGWKVNTTDDYEAAADVNLAGSKLYGATAANGNLTLSATIHGTVTTAYIVAENMIDATAGSIAIHQNSGAVGDDTGTQTSINGELVIDDSNNRIYWRQSGPVWKFVNADAGIQVPIDELDCPKCGKLMKIGDELTVEADSHMPDGALHALWCHAKCQ